MQQNNKGLVLATVLQWQICSRGAKDTKLKVNEMKYLINAIFQEYYTEIHHMQKATFSARCIYVGHCNKNSTPVYR